METCCDSFDSHIQICENPECKDRLIDFAVIPTLKEILPVGYRHLVCYCASNSDDHKHFEATVRINLSSRQDAEKWKNSFRETSKITLRVRRTLPTSLTKVIYKVEYKCQHNTQPRTLLAKTRKSSKNTNCPSTVFVTVYNTEFFNYEGHRRRIRSSDCHRTEFPALVKIRYCHNHPVNTASSLKFRDVSEKARSRVEQLILQGYSPVATLEMYHFDLQMEYGNDYVYLCSDRAFCPDKDFVYRMFYKLSNQKCRERQRTEITQLKDHVDNLERCLQKQSSDDSTLSLFGCEADSQESLIMEDCQTSAPTASAADLQRSCVKKYLDMEVTEEGQLILVVCTPLMHRVHKLLPHSQQMVFMDGTGSVDRNHCRVFLLLTHSCVGGLPLGVIVTTSESPQTIKRGLELLCSLIGEAGFGGRGRKGPAIFMTNDSKAERAGIEEVFPEAVIFLSVFHILRTFWRYLWDSKNGVAVLHRPAMFGLLKGMVYASSVEELNAQYKYAVENDTLQKHPKVLEYVNNLIERKMLWAVCHRENLSVQGHHINNFAEVTMQALKAPILNRTKALTEQQLVDFIVGPMERYYEGRCKTVTKDHCKMQQSNCMIPSVLDTQTINLIEENIYEVSSTEEPDVKYVVNMTLGMCTCKAGCTGGPCRHQAGICKKNVLPCWNVIPETGQEMCQLLNYIGSGINPVRVKDEFSTDENDTGKSGLTSDEEQVIETSDVLTEFRQIVQCWEEKMEADPLTFKPALQSLVQNYRRIQNDAHLASAMHAFGKFSRDFPSEMT